MTGDFETRLLAEDGRELQAALRALPRTPPPGLRTSLRVIASRERQRRLAAQRGWWARLGDWSDRVSLRGGNLMPRSRCPSPAAYSPPSFCSA